MESRFYAYLKKIRESKSLTQEQVAKRIGVSRTTYVNYEAGKRSPDFETLLDISDVLDCSIDALFGREGKGTVSYILKEDKVPYPRQKKENTTLRHRSNKKKGIGLGVEEFRKLRRRNGYYVDKTMMIEEFLESNWIATLITRPRRFGKTLNMSMLAEFLDCTKESADIFQGTKISEMPQYIELNQHPVISLSFLNAKGDTEEILLRRIYEALFGEYLRYEKIWQDERVAKTRRDNMMEIYKVLSRRNQSVVETKDIAAVSILELCMALEEYYGEGVYLFLDEYDTPFISANIGGYYHKVRGFLSTLFSSSLKGNTALEKAMLTGIQRVAKENIFSGLNNLTVCTLADDAYASYFGFTESEVKEVLEYYNLVLTDEVKQMYDGYHIGGIDLYNPWSVTNYACMKKLESYWVNTSENSMIERAMDICGLDFSKEYEKLIEKGRVSAQVEMKNSFFEQPSKQALWGMLIHAGMVTIENVIENEFFSLKIPNQEVRTAFARLTAHNLQVSHGSMATMFWKLKQCEFEDFIDEYKAILLTLPSYHDLKDENSYHMMMLGMCVYLCDEYEVKSNREAGLGRSDICLKSLRDGKPSFVLEFKYTKDENADLEKLATEAMNQIEEKQYAWEMNGEVIYMGLAHFGKKAEIAYKKIS